MKKVIREVKELRPFITQRTTCVVLAMLLAFIANAVPVMLDAPFGILIVLYILFYFYSYVICLISYMIVIPSRRRVRKADIDDFLINNGEHIDVNKKVRMAFVNPFTKKIFYKTKTNKGHKAVFIFNIKNNSYSKRISNCAYPIEWEIKNK